MLRLQTCSVLLVLCSVAAHGGEARVEVSILVPPLQRLEVSPEVSVTRPVSPLDLSSGFMDLSQPIRLTVFSNSPWELCIRQPEGSTRLSQPGTPRVQWRDEGREYSDLPTEWMPIASGSAPAAGLVLDLHLRILFDWRSGRPGYHEPRVEYRLTAVNG